MSDQAETLQSAREPDCDVRPLAGLPRHPYNRMLGDRTPEEMERMKEMLMRSSHTIQIWTLGGHVLSDWDAYRIAIDESLPTLIQEYIGEDPAAFACMKHFMGSVSTKPKRVASGSGIPLGRARQAQKPCTFYRVFNQWSNPADCRTNGRVSQLPRIDHQPGQADLHGRCCGTSDGREAYG